MGSLRWGGVVGLLALSLLMPGRAGAEGGAAAVARGQVIVSDVLIAPVAALESSASVAAALRRVARPVVTGSGGFWRFHFLAFLDTPVPASGAVELVAWDTTDPKHRRVVRVFELPAEPGAVELRVNDFVVSTALGFERDHHYELAIAYGDPGAPGDQAQKHDVQARGVVTLR